MLLLLFLTGITILMGGGAAAVVAALTAGAGGPAATASVLFGLILVVAGALGLLLYGLPIVLLSASTLLCAIPSGYRYLRWTRFFGIAANLIGLAYFIIIHIYEYAPATVLYYVIAYTAFNCLLFIILPKRPNLPLTKHLTKYLHPLIYAAVVAALLVLIATDGIAFETSEIIFLLIVAALYYLPFHFNFKTVEFAASGISTRQLWKRLAVSAILSILLVAVFFPLGIPLAISTILLVELAEIALLYPPETPEGATHFWAVKALGRLPESRPLPDAGEQPILENTEQ